MLYIRRKPKTKSTEIMKHQKRKYMLIKAVPFLFMISFFVILFDIHIFHDMSMHANIAVSTVFIRNYDRGDVVVIDTGDMTQARRIIGMPGDEIIFDYDTIYINGQRCIETYQTEPTYSETYSFVVPEHAYFVLSDERTGFGDSRSYGAVYEQAILQKVIFMI